MIQVVQTLTTADRRWCLELAVSLGSKERTLTGLLEDAQAIEGYLQGLVQLPLRRDMSPDYYTRIQEEISR